MPTALLPRFGVEWSATDADHHVTANYRLDGAEIELHYTLGDDARMRSVVFGRWDDPDNKGTWGHHPFGFEVTGYSTFEGVTIPSAGRAGRLYGTDRWNERVLPIREHRPPPRHRGEQITLGSSLEPCRQEPISHFVSLTHLERP